MKVISYILAVFFWWVITLPCSALPVPTTEPPADDQDLADDLRGVALVPADRSTIEPENLARARTAFASLLDSGQDVEAAKQIAYQAMREFDGTTTMPAFVAELKRELATDPASQRLNLAMAVLTESGSRDHFHLEVHRAYNMKLPVWLRLTRYGDFVRAAFSEDGKRWEGLDRQAVPLGLEPLAVLPIMDPPRTYNKVLTPAVTAIVDHCVPLLAPKVSSAAESPLPAPWRQIDLPPRSNQDDLTSEPSSAASPPAPSTVRADGSFLLRAAGGELLQPGDAGRLVYRPLGDNQRVAVRIVSFDANTAAYTGLMLRAGPAVEAPFAAILINGEGMVFSFYRDGPEPSLNYWRKVAELRPADKTAQLALAEKLFWYGYPDEAIAICDRLIATDPLWMFGSQRYELQRIFGESASPQLGERLLKWRPASSLSDDDKRHLADTFASSASECAKQKRPDLVAPLCQRSLELHDPQGVMDWGSERGPDVHRLLFNALVALNRRDEAACELLSRLVPLHPPVDKPENIPFYYSGWLSYVYGSDNISMPFQYELDIARETGLLPNLETAFRARLAQPDCQRLLDSGGEWLLAFIRLHLHDLGVLGRLPALFNGDRGVVNDSRMLERIGPAVLHLTAARELQQWPEHERLALDALHTAPGLLDCIRDGSGDQMNSIVGLQAARAEVQLGDITAACATLRALAENLSTKGHTLASATTPGGLNGNADYSRRCLALLQRLPGTDADALFLHVLERLRQGPFAAKFGAPYELEKQRRLAHDILNFPTPLPAPLSPNLIVNPGFDGLSTRDPDAATFDLPGWKDLPPGFWLPGTLSPPPHGQSFVQCEIFSGNGGSTLRDGHYVPTGERVIQGERIPLAKDHAYHQRAWLRDAGDDGYVHFGRNYLAEDGHLLKTTECPEPSSPVLGWREVSQRLSSITESSAAITDPIPAGTAFVQLYLKWYGAVDWAGLYLGQSD